MSGAVGVVKMTVDYVHVALLVKMKNLELLLVKKSKGSDKN